MTPCPHCHAPSAGFYTEDEASGIVTNYFRNDGAFTRADYDDLELETGDRIHCRHCHAIRRDVRLTDDFKIVAAPAPLAAERKRDD
jgi:hypothetical protein